MPQQPAAPKAAVAVKPIPVAKRAPAPTPTEIVAPPLPEPEPGLLTGVEAVDLEPEPEPAQTAADFVPPTQDELAATGVRQQNVSPRGAMEPGEDTTTKVPVPYKFTDADRAKAAASRNKLAKFDWEVEPMDECLAYLAELRAETERGGLVLQRRISEQRQSHAKCFACDNIIDIGAGRFAGSKTRNNFDTGLPEVAYACSAKCYIIMGRDFRHTTYAEEVAKG